MAEDSRQKLLDLIRDFRHHWQEIEDRDLEYTPEYKLGFVILHGLVERMPVSSYNENLDIYFRDSRRRLEEGNNKKLEIVRFLKKAVENGLEIPVLDVGDDDGSKDIRFSLEDLCQVVDVRGRFGYVSLVERVGYGVIQYRIILLNQDCSWVENSIDVNLNFMNRTKLPEEYRQEAVGICWVEYFFCDKRKFGNLEPASSLEFPIFD